MASIVANTVLPIFEEVEQKVSVFLFDLSPSSSLCITLMLVLNSNFLYYFCNVFGPNFGTTLAVPASHPLGRIVK